MNQGGTPPWAEQGYYGGSPYSSPDRDDKFQKARSKDPVAQAVTWFKSRSPVQRLVMALVVVSALLMLLKFTIEDHDTLFVLAEATHFIGIGLLGFKLLTKKSVAGLSLRSQELTGIFLGLRLVCSFLMEKDIHTLLDGLTLAATAAVIYGMRFTAVRQTYQKEQDTVKLLYVLGPCVVLAIFAHPSTSHWLILRIMWGTCVYLEAVSVLPQLRMMQRAQVVERFTAHYVFCLGISRFLSCAHWILQILEGNRYLFAALGSGMWPAMVLVSEVVQTFILADFCYYYLKSYAEGQPFVRMPSGVV